MKRLIVVLIALFLISCEVPVAVDDLDLPGLSKSEPRVGTQMLLVYGLFSHSNEVIYEITVSGDTPTTMQDTLNELRETPTDKEYYSNTYSINDTSITVFVKVKNISVPSSAIVVQYGIIEVNEEGLYFISSGESRKLEEFEEVEIIFYGGKATFVSSL